MPSAYALGFVQTSHFGGEALATLAPPRADKNANVSADRKKTTALGTEVLPHREFHPHPAARKIGAVGRSKKDISALDIAVSNSHPTELVIVRYSKRVVPIRIRVLRQPESCSCMTEAQRL